MCPRQSAAPFTLSERMIFVLPNIQRLVRIDPVVTRFIGFPTIDVDLPTKRLTSRIRIYKWRTEIALLLLPAELAH